MNNPTLGEFCFTMVGRADIEESKSNVAMNAWLPQASYPCGNFSDTSGLKLLKGKGSIGHSFLVHSSTGRLNQASFSPFSQRAVSVRSELALGHLCYLLTDVPPQPNSPPGGFSCLNQAPELCLLDRISKATLRVVVFQSRVLPLILHLLRRSTRQTRVKLNRVFFPR